VPLRTLSGGAALVIALGQGREGRLDWLPPHDVTPKDYDGDTVFERFARYAIDGIGSLPFELAGSKSAS